MNADHLSESIDPQVTAVTGRQGSLLEGHGERDRHQTTLAETIQPVVGADPDVSLAVLQYSVDVVGGQAVLGCKALDGSADPARLPFQTFGNRHTAHSVAESGDPQSALSIEEDRGGPDPDFRLGSWLLVISERNWSDRPRCLGHPYRPIGRVGQLPDLTHPNPGRLKPRRSRR